MNALMIIFCAIMFVGCVIGTVGEIVAAHWPAAVFAAVPTGIFLALLILATVTFAKEIPHV